MYFGGNFSHINGVLVNRIAKWDGTNWSALGSGLDKSVRSLALDNNDNLYAGGTFSSARGKPSSGFALWGPATLTSPAPGDILSGENDTFQWTPNVPDVTDWWFYMGSKPESPNYYNSGLLNASDLEETVSNLPTDGSTIYAKLWYKIKGDTSWRFTNITYQASGTSPTVTPPDPDTQLDGAAQLFTWQDNVANATELWIDAGSAMGSNDYYNRGSLGNALSVTVSGLLIDGLSDVHVRLWYRVGSGPWLFNDKVYTAGTTGMSTPVITTPAGATLAGVSDTFSWIENGSGAKKYWDY